MGEIVDFAERARLLTLERAKKRLRLAERMLEREYSMRVLVQVNQAKLVVLLLENGPDPRWVLKQRTRL